MTAIIGTFRIGEDISVALDGDMTGVSAVTAKMKPALLTGGTLTLDDAATATSLTVTTNGTSGWLISLDHATTAGLAEGVYGIDAKLSYSGLIEITEETAFIQISRAAVE